MLAWGMCPGVDGVRGPEVGDGDRGLGPAFGAGGLEVGVADGHVCVAQGCGLLLELSKGLDSQRNLDRRSEVGV